MKQHVALLRAVNVPGHPRVKMADLTEAFARAGCQNVRTIIQSGNVLFETPNRGMKSLVRRVHAELLSLLEAEPIIAFRTLDEIQELVKQDPFRRYKCADDLKLYIAFLTGRPGQRPSLPMSLPQEALEVISVNEFDVAVVSRRKKNGGFGFPNSLVEQQFQVGATSRNWNTVLKIADGSRRP